MKTYTLLIWNWNPENIQVYTIPNDELTEEQSEALTEAHGHYINGDVDYRNNDGLMFLNVAVLEDTQQNREDNAKEKYLADLGKLCKYLRYDLQKNRGAEVLNPSGLFNEGESMVVTKVVVSGFIL